MGFCIEIAFLRSSLKSTWDICNHRAYLEYSLGFKQPSGKAACRGTCLHKAAELIALRKLAIQNNQSSFYEDSLQREFTVDELTPDLAVEVSYNYYRELESHLEWDEKDKTDCRKWLDIVLKEINFDEREVFSAEHFFNLQVENIKLRGTVDLILKEDNSTLQYLDFKTGAAKNWASGETKNFDNLRHDFQLRLYYYALNQLFPDYEILMSIFYINNIGLVYIPLDKQELPKIKKELLDFAKEVEETKITKPIYPDYRCNWCAFAQKLDSGNTICEVMHAKLKKYGMEEVTSKYRRSTFGSYAGGGRTSETSISQNPRS